MRLSTRESKETTMRAGRRRFVRNLSAALAAYAVPRSAAGGEPRAEQKGWIDAHVHVWTRDIRRFPLAPGYGARDMRPPSFTPEAFLAHAGPAGVSRAVLIQMSYYGTDNRFMLQSMQRFPGIFAGVAVIDEQTMPAADMQRLRDQGVRGIRIAPGNGKPDMWLSGEGMHQMWRCGAEQQIAICHLVDPVFLPSIDAMCARYPDTPVVVDHFGRVGIDGTIRDRDLDNLCQLARRPHTAVKVSAFYALGRKREPYTDLLPMIRRLLDAFGPQRLMWASDCPFQVANGRHYRPSIDLLREHANFLSPDDRQWILRKTAERIFFS